MFDCEADKYACLIFAYIPTKGVKMSSEERTNECGREDEVWGTVALTSGVEYIIIKFNCV